MRRFFPSVATVALLIATIAVAQLVPAPAARTVEGSPVPSPRSSIMFHSEAAALDVRLPTGWHASDRQEFFNRATARLAVIANGPLPPSPPPDRFLILDESTVALEIFSS